MDAFWDHKYYKLNKTQMSQFGMWPEQTLFMRIALNTLHVASLCACLVFQATAMIQGRSDPYYVVECLPPSLSICIALAKLLNANVNRNKANKLLDRIKFDWSRYSVTPNIDILHKYGKRGRMITIYYAIYVYTSLFLYLCMPLSAIALDFIDPLNETRPKRLLYNANYGVDEKKYWWPIYGHECLATISLIAIFVTNDTMYFTFTEHVCGLFEMVGANMNLTKNPKYDHFKNDNRKRIFYCVNLHKEALTFAELIESNYSTMFSVIIGLCVIAMSITLVQMALSMGQAEDMIRHGTFILGQVSHLFFISRPGQEIINYSLKVQDDIYDAEWTEFDIKNQKLLMFLIMRSQKACRISAAKIYILSMESFRTVTQTAVSYFTVLTSML